MDLNQFLAWEAQQELRFEYDGLQIFAMTGGTVAHVTLEGNVFTALRSRLSGKPCRAYTSNLKIKMAGSIRYADASVVCTPLSPTATYTTAPVVVFEIMSKSSAATDIGAKSAEYQATPSVQRYIVLQQDRHAAHVFFRTPDGWELEFADGTSVLDMPEIGIAVPMAEIYEDLALEG